MLSWRFFYEHLTILKEKMKGKGNEYLARCYYNIIDSCLMFLIHTFYCFIDSIHLKEKRGYLNFLLWHKIIQAYQCIKLCIYYVTISVIWLYQTLLDSLYRLSQGCGNNFRTAKFSFGARGLHSSSLTLLAELRFLQCVQILDESKS